MPSTRQASCPFDEYIACGIDHLRNLRRRLSHALARPGRRFVVSLPRVPRAARPAHARRRADGRAARRAFRCCAESSRTASRTTSRSCSTRRARRSATSWYPQYKANRPPMPDDLAAQIAPLHALVRAHGWPLLMVEGVEADDVIGTLAKRAKKLGIDTTISSSDKDLAQLVEPGITMVNTMSNETLDDAGVLAKFGVRADQILDLLTLTGDAVDNVPGVDKVGPKTAAKWLGQYGTLDAVVKHAGDIGGKVGENLRAALDWLPRGRELLTVKTDCDLPVGPRDLVPTAPDGEALQRALRALRLQELAARGRRRPDGGHAGGRGRRDRRARRRRRTRGATTRSTASTSRRASPPTSPTNACSTSRRSRAGRDAIDKAPLVAFDTETTSLDPMAAEIVGLSFAIAPGRPATCRSHTAMPARPTSSRANTCSVRCAAGSPTRRRRSSARTSSTTSTRSRTTASRSPASRTTRCSSPTCSRRTVRTTWTASRGATSTGRRSRTARSPARARRRSASTRWRSTARPSTRPRMPTSRCACTRRCIRSSPPTRSSATSTKSSRCRCARCCSGWSAPAC